MALNEVPIYDKSGRFSFYRIGTDVYRPGKGRRIYYIDDNGVYDRAGVRRFQISGGWWYTGDGVAAYYEGDAIGGGDDDAA